MNWIPTRSVVLAGALIVASTGVAPLAAAQSAPAARGTASWSAFRPTVAAAPSEGAAATASRRRPTRRSTVRDSSYVYSPPTSSVASRGASASMSAERIAMVSSTLRMAGQPWLGTPYRWGGDSRRGIDCSAFVRQFMQDNLAVELPRTTAGQQYEGLSVSKDDLLPGDLVFFRRRGVRHVGVYLGNSEFIHASSSRGVTVSDLNSDYWMSAYWMSRRVLSEPSGRRPTPRREAGVRG